MSRSQLTLEKQNKYNIGVNFESLGIFVTGVMPQNCNIMFHLYKCLIRKIFYANVHILGLFNWAPGK